MNGCVTADSSMIKLHSEPHQGQRILLEVEFENRHNPGNEEHIDAILENFFRGKGVKYQDGKLKV